MTILTTSYFHLLMFDRFTHAAYSPLLIIPVYGNFIIIFEISELTRDVLLCSFKRLRPSAFGINRN